MEQNSSEDKIQKFKEDKGHQKLSTNGTFKGKDLVNWLWKESYSATRPEAVEFAATLMANSVFYSVERDIPFEDSSASFRFSSLDLTPSTTKKTTSDKPKVVILGGGLSGSYLALELQRDFDITLIDNKDYFEAVPVLPRALANHSFLGNLRVYHKAYLKNGEFILGTVTDVDTTQVTVQTDTEVKTVPYNYLMICTGCSYKSPTVISSHTNSERSKGSFILDVLEDLKTAKSIAVIGGGPVGVEYVGMLLEKYPNKNFTLVSHSKELLERLPVEGRKHAAKVLTDMKCKLILGERFSMESKDGNRYKTDAGTEFEADLVIQMVGLTPNSKFMQNNFSQVLDERGYIRVTPSLQVPDFPNIFALGDVNNCHAEKMAFIAELHAKLVSENVKLLDKKQETKPLPPPMSAMLVPIGTNYAVALMNGKVLTGPLFMLNGFKGMAGKAEIHHRSGCRFDKTSKCMGCTLSKMFSGK